MDVYLERARSWAFVLVALVSFIAGVALGQLGAVRGPGHSRAEWPAPPARPRSIQP